MLNKELNAKTVGTLEHKKKVKVNEVELFEVNEDIKLADLLTLLENNNVTNDDKVEII